MSIIGLLTLIISGAAIGTIFTYLAPATYLEPDYTTEESHKLNQD